MGIFVSRNSEVKETLLADVFRLYRPAFPGKVLKVNIDKSIHVNDIPELDAICLNRDNKNRLFIVSRSLDKQIKVELDSHQKIVDSITLCGENTRQGKFRIVSSDTKSGGICLPPLTVTRVSMKGGI